MDKQDVPFSLVYSPVLEINSFFSHSETSLFEEYDSAFAYNVGRFEDWAATTAEKRKTALSVLLDRLDSTKSCSQSTYSLLFCLLGCPYYATSGSTQVSLSRQAAVTLLELGAIPVILFHVSRVASLVADDTPSSTSHQTNVSLLSSLLSLYYIILVHCKEHLLLRDVLVSADEHTPFEDSPRNAAVGGRGGGAALLFFRLLSDGVESHFCCTKKILLSLSLTLTIQLGDIPAPCTGNCVVFSRLSELSEIFKDHVDWKYPEPIYESHPEFIKEALSIINERVEVTQALEEPEGVTIMEESDNQFEILFRQLYFDLQRIVIILLRMLLHAGPASSSDATYSGTILDVTHDFSVLPSSLIKLRHPNESCECPTCSMADHESNRHCEIVIRSTVTVLALLFYHSFQNNKHQFLYLRKLMIKSSSNLLILKILNQDIGSVFTCLSTSDDVIRLLEYPIIAPLLLSNKEVLNSAKSSIPPRTPLRSRILDGNNDKEEEGDENDEKTNDEVVDKCEAVPLTSDDSSSPKRRVQLKSQDDDDMYSTPKRNRPLGHKGVLTPLSRSITRQQSLLLSRTESGLALNLSDIEEEDDQIAPKVMRSFVSITLLCFLLEGLVQNESNGLIYLQQTKAHIIFRHILQCEFIDIKMILLRMFKRLSKFLGKRWSNRNSAIITDIYMLLPFTESDLDAYFFDEWLMYPSSIDPSSIPSLPFSSSYMDDHALPGTMTLSSLSDGVAHIKKAYENWWTVFGIEKPSEYLYRNDLLAKFFNQDFFKLTDDGVTTDESDS
ncbi:hypothetical protein GEMRC1_004204 [Eukaryota sp. GEM-RC1]